MNGSRTRTLVEAGLVVALAYVLGRLVLYRMPLGGSVSLEMLPLMVFALRRGAAAGIGAGVLYGLLNFTVDPQPVVHWMQFGLDYPVAHGLVGLTGLAAGAWRAAALPPARATLFVVVPATLAGSLARAAAHWLSGLAYFGQYAPAGQPAWLYSLVYNGSYMLPSAVLCALAAAVVLPALQRAVPVR